MYKIKMLEYLFARLFILIGASSSLPPEVPGGNKQILPFGDWKLK